MDSEVAKADAVPGKQPVVDGSDQRRRAKTGQAACAHDRRAKEMSHPSPSFTTEVEGQPAPAAIFRRRGWHGQQPHGAEQQFNIAEIGSELENFPGQRLSTLHVSWPEHLRS